MATVKCKAVVQGVVPRRSSASLEWYAGNKPQYYCYGYINAMNDEFIEPCQNCPYNIGKAQIDYERYLATGIIRRKRYDGQHR